MNDDHDPDELKVSKGRQRKKPLSPYYQANNKGGYGNPPVSGQRQGQAGPGRPPGSHTLDSALRRMIKSDVPLKNGGSKPYVDALAFAARDASLGKTVKASEFGFKLVRRFEAQEDDKVRLDLSTFSIAEQILLVSFLSRAMDEEPDPPRSDALNPKI